MKNTTVQFCHNLSKKQSQRPLKRALSTRLTARLLSLIMILFPTLGPPLQDESPQRLQKIFERCKKRPSVGSCRSTQACYQTELCRLCAIHFAGSKPRSKCSSSTIIKTLRFPVVPHLKAKPLPVPFTIRLAIYV